MRRIGEKEVKSKVTLPVAEAGKDTRVGLER